MRLQTRPPSVSSQQLLEQLQLQLQVQLAIGIAMRCLAAAALLLRLHMLVLVRTPMPMQIFMMQQSLTCGRLAMLVHKYLLHQHHGSSVTHQPCSSDSACLMVLPLLTVVSCAA